MEEKPDIKKLLLFHYAEFIKKSGDRTMKQFSEYLGENDKVLSAVINGKRPLTKNMAHKFALILNDMRFYDAAGAERPNEYSFRIEREWDVMPEEYRKVVREAINEYVAKKTKE